jgi:type III secretion protein V
MSNSKSLPLGRHAFRHTDIAVVTMVIAIVSLMVIPMPAYLLDLLIAVNIALSIALLMLAAYVPSMLSLSTFPSLLLFTTLLRLSLNIASTKQILLHADAGDIIDTFGRLVVGGNVIVGLVVFLIIAIVQFIVIAKGSERVAEVGARFTLDAMPGKQMSIDADLRAGSIDKDDAHRQRTLLEKESQFHGAMDGAMKFVKGDAIAGLLIAFVNLVAGFAVGVLMHDMSAAASAQRYTVLTVGDGMVSQIPSLFVSIAAGALITRVGAVDGAESNLGSDIGRQFLAQPLALLLTGTILMGFLLVPGFPKIQFGLLALAAGLTGFWLRRRISRPSNVGETPMPSFRADGTARIPQWLEPEADGVTTALGLELTPGLAERLAPRALDAALEGERQLRVRQLGVPFPGVRAMVNPRLAPGAYAILVHDVPLETGLLPPDGWWRAADAPALPAAALASAQVQAQAAFGPFPPGQWVAFSPDASPDVDPENMDPPLLGAEQVLARHLAHVFEQRAAQFIGMQEVQRLIDSAATRLPELTQELIRTLPLQRITDVMRRLVQEQVSIRNLRDICESLVLWGPKEKDVVMLTEYVRVDLGRATAFRHSGGRPTLPVIVAGPELESLLRSSVQQSLGGSFLALAPEQQQDLTARFRNAHSHASANDLRTVVVASIDVRRYVKKMLSMGGLEVTVLSFQELGSHVSLQAVGHVDL